jgi:hypothetical protein
MAPSSSGIHNSQFFINQFSCFIVAVSEAVLTSIGGTGDGIASRRSASLRHQEASTELVTALHGPKTADPIATIGLFKTLKARLVAMPPF